MDKFPDFMRNPANAIAASQKTQGVEGYVFDGVDGSQMAIFQCANGGVSAEHVHDFEEYFVVLQGEYTLIMGSERIKVTSGQEYLIPKGVPHAGEFTAGTRTVHAFGGKRAQRAGGSNPTECKSLEAVRQNIDRLDREIVRLLSERGGFVSQAARFKKTIEEVKAPGRVEEVIRRVRVLAQEQNLNPEIVEPVYRAMIKAFIEEEAKSRHK